MRCGPRVTLHSPWAKNEMNENNASDIYLSTLFFLMANQLMRVMDGVTVEGRYGIIRVLFVVIIHRYDTLMIDIIGTYHT